MKIKEEEKLLSDIAWKIRNLLTGGKTFFTEEELNKPITLREVLDVLLKLEVKKVSDVLIKLEVNKWS